MTRQRAWSTAMLSRELDILMGERQTLLKIVGATAALIASLDSRLLPPAAIVSADLVATGINTLPDETLCDALAAVHAKIEDDEPVVSN